MKTGEDFLSPEGGSVDKPSPDSIPPRTELHPIARALDLSVILLFVTFSIIAYHGVSIISYERLERRVDGLAGSSTESILGLVSGWKQTAGVATRARNLALEIILAEDPANGVAIEDALDEVVKASPTSTAAWQARAAYQRARGAPMERVLPGFHMSVLTGSHEGYYMAQRAMFGLEHWTELPEEDQRTVIRDLVGSAMEFGPDRYRYIVDGKTQAERDEIRAAIIASGHSSRALLQALGI
jgi:hypothetical protein